MNVHHLPRHLIRRTHLTLSAALRQTLPIPNVISTTPTTHHPSTLPFSHRSFSMSSSSSSQEPQQGKQQKPDILSTEVLNADEAKFIEIKKLNYVDQTGRKRVWEVAQRKTRNESGVDAVAILALLHSPGKPVSTVIIEQYRPPINSVCIEMPAGLIDPKEGPKATALRELHEETGYGGDSKEGGKATVRDISPVVVADPGMTNANMQFVVVDVELPEGDLEPPKAKLEEGEHIVQRVVEISKLYETLIDYDKKGFTVDARLLHLAMGFNLSKQLSL